MARWELWQSGWGSACLATPDLKVEGGARVTPRACNRGGGQKAAFYPMPPARNQHLALWPARSGRRHALVITRPAPPNHHCHVNGDSHQLLCMDGSEDAPADLKEATPRDGRLPYVKGKDKIGLGVTGSRLRIAGNELNIQIGERVLSSATENTVQCGGGTAGCRVSWCLGLK